MFLLVYEYKWVHVSELWTECLKLEWKETKHDFATRLVYSWVENSVNYDGTIKLLLNIFPNKPTTPNTSFTDYHNKHNIQWKLIMLLLTIAYPVPVNNSPEIWPSLALSACPKASHWLSVLLCQDGWPTSRVDTNKNARTNQFLLIIIITHYHSIRIISQESF